MAKGKSILQRSLLKSFILLIALLLILFIAQRIGNFVEFSQRILNGGGEEPLTSISGITYTPEEQEKLKKEFYGFWHFIGTLDDSVRYEDYMELKENGIIWQYQKFVYPLPYNEIDSLYRVSTSYLLPYQSLDSNSTLSLCYNKLIRQNWVIDTTPCYGKSVNLIDNMYNGTAERSDIIKMWKVERVSDDTLGVNGLSYIRYKGDKYKFFNNDAVKAIESVDDPAVEACDGEDPQLTWIRGKIIAAIESQPLSDVVILEQKRNIKKYYIPYCLNRLEVNYGANEGAEIELTFTVSPSGRITDVKIAGEPFKYSSSLATILKDEIMKWKLHGSGKEETFTVTTIAKSNL